MSLVIKTILIGIVLLLWWRLVRYVYISYRALPKLGGVHQVMLIGLLATCFVVFTVLALAFILPVYHFPF